MTFVDGRQHDFWRVDEARLRAALAAPLTPVSDPGRTWAFSHVLARVPGGPDGASLGLFSRSQTPTVNEPHGRAPVRQPCQGWPTRPARSMAWRREL